MSRNSKRNARLALEYHTRKFKNGVVFSNRNNTDIQENGNSCTVIDKYCINYCWVIEISLYLR